MWRGTNLNFLKSYFFVKTQQQNTIHGIWKDTQILRKEIADFPLFHSRAKILVRNMKCMSQHTKRIFKHVTVMEASVGWRMGVVEMIGITGITLIHVPRDGERREVATLMWQNSSLSRGSKRQLLPKEWQAGRWGWLQPGQWWGAALHMNMVGRGWWVHQHSLTRQEVNQIQGPHKEYCQEEMDPGPKPELDTRLRHGSKVHPGDRDKDRTGDKEQGSAVPIQANNLHSLIF